MRILVVEDERRIADYIKKGLVQKGMVVDVAYDGENGFDLAMEEEYDVLVLDWMLPGMSGLEICKSLREEENQVPVLILTAKGEVDNRVLGLESGADDYLVKPFAFAELMARVKALGRRSKQRSGEVLEVEDLSLDTNSYEVRRGGKLIELSKQEYALLEFLMRHPEKVFTAEQLVEQVWSYDSEVLANTAQVYMGYLRKKIDKAFAELEPLVKTVRGFGYKFG
jgi:DNA-binding response OmpR family regulator